MRSDPDSLGPATLLVASATLLAAAPVVVAGGYSVVEHTTSESAGQLVAGSWVARSGFVCLALAVLWLARGRSADRAWGRAGTVAHVAFGICMLGTAVFSARSWQPAAPFDGTEDLLHSVASFGVGVGFILGVLLVGGHRGRETGRSRRFDVFALLVVVSLLVAMSALPGLEGVLQRCMFVVAYLWYGTESLAPEIRVPGGVRAP